VKRDILTLLVNRRAKKSGPPNFASSSPSDGSTPRPGCRLVPCPRRRPWRCRHGCCRADAPVQKEACVPSFGRNRSNARKKPRSRKAPPAPHEQRRRSASVPAVGTSSESSSTATSLSRSSAVSSTCRGGNARRVSTVARGQRRVEGMLTGARRDIPSTVQSAVEAFAMRRREAQYTWCSSFARKRAKSSSAGSNSGVRGLPRKSRVPSTTTNRCTSACISFICNHSSSRSPAREGPWISQSHQDRGQGDSIQELQSPPL
jgi:hypothetical protein